ncbi:MAG: bifunctional riboflavin kinase/FAD synthetase [Ruminococcus sp.]|nr:bifunctional riboflavin kinase/FAD synthetase [Ruminococcus sp.]
MKVFTSLDEFAKTGYHTSVALGFFDGVHLGHQAVIKNAVKNSGSLCSAVLTFSEPPAKTLTGSAPPLLTTNELKQKYFEVSGAHALIFADFSSLRDLSPQDFVGLILKEKMRAEKVFCGFNYHFGSKGAGDTGLLSALCSQYGIEVQVSDPVYYAGEIISSTRIRSCLSQGKMKKVRAMLGRPYILSGKVSEGNRIGSSLGFPTLNFAIDPTCAVPRYGVYASRVLINGKFYRGATNIGVHPTVKENASPLCETFLLGYEGGDLYDAEVFCQLLRFIRPEKKFSSLEELQKQIKNDIESISRTG